MLGMVRAHLVDVAPVYSQSSGSAYIDLSFGELGIISHRILPSERMNNMANIAFDVPLHQSHLTMTAAEVQDYKARIKGAA